MKISTLGVIFGALFSLLFASCNTTKMIRTQTADHRAVTIHHRTRHVHLATKKESTGSKKSNFLATSKAETVKDIPATASQVSHESRSAKTSSNRDNNDINQDRRTSAVESKEASQDAADILLPVEPSPIPQNEIAGTASSNNSEDQELDNKVYDQFIASLNDSFEKELQKLSRDAEVFPPAQTPVIDVPSSKVSSFGPTAPVQTETTTNAITDNYGLSGLWLFGTDPVKKHIALREFGIDTNKQVAVPIQIANAEPQNSPPRPRLSQNRRSNPASSRHGSLWKKIQGAATSALRSTRAVFSNIRFPSFNMKAYATFIRWMFIALGVVLISLFAYKFRPSRNVSSIVSSWRWPTWAEMKEWWLDFLVIRVYRPFRKIVPRKMIEAPPITPTVAKENDTSHPYGHLKFRKTENSDNSSTSDGQAFKVLPSVVDSSYSSSGPIRQKIPAIVVWDAKSINGLAKNIEQLKGEGFGLKHPRHDGEMPAKEIRSHLATLEKLMEEYKRGVSYTKKKDFPIILQRNIMHLPDEIGLRAFVVREIQKSIPTFSIEPTEVSRAEAEGQAGSVA